MIDKNEINRVILIDWSIFVHKSIFAWVNRQEIPATYTAINMMFGCLRALRLQPDDLVIVALDARNNWRKKVDPEYKANRKQAREDSGIDWTYWFKEFDNIIFRLRQCTPFFYIQIDTLEADDIIASVPKYYTDKEIIVVSTDSDFEQLASYKNVKLFSSSKKEFKVVKNPYSLIYKKIEKETTDNLITAVNTEEEFRKRNLLVNLLTLPNNITQLVVDKLNELCYNDYNVDLMPFKSLRSRLIDIYSIPAPKKKGSNNVHIGQEIF